MQMGMIDLNVRTISTAGRALLKLVWGSYTYFPRGLRYGEGILLSVIAIVFLENERNHDLPVARVITSKLFLVFPMLLHGPIRHRTRAHNEEQTA